ncbi:MAG: thiol:disulfide interchange protein [Verrucomicrobia bacterium]|nr:thiol:disulfide interchange protein [Verrucomicrobiota bacterium]
MGQIPQLFCELGGNRFHLLVLAYPIPMRRPTPAFLRCLPCLLLLQASLWADPVAKTPQLVVDLLAEPTPLQSGKPVTLALRFRPAPGWHIYWSNPGDSGLPPSVTWKLPPGWTAGELQFPSPEKILVPPLVSYGYEQETLLLTTFSISDHEKMPSSFPIEADIEWLVCKETCLPGKAHLNLTLPTQPKPNIDLQGLFDDVRRDLPVSIPSIPISAVTEGSTLRLTVQPKTQVGSLTLFPEGDFLDEFKPSKTESLGSGKLQLTLPLKEKAKLPPSLQGVLVAEKPWDSSGHRALAISLPLGSALRSLGEGGPSSRLPEILLFAFLGGLILNVMPCVFPILSLKALHLVQIASESRSTARREGLAFGSGVLLSLLALAGLLILLRASGQALGWGFQLQSPPVVWLLLALLYALSLNLLGVFEFQVLLSGLANQSPRQGWTGAFASGLLAVAVASPCTAPFMGVALAAAFALPAVGTLLVFSSLAFGFALPVLLFSLFPNLLKFLPKPGAWMITFKKVLSLPMLAAVLWLGWVAFRLSGTTAMLPIVLGLLFLTLGLIVYGKAQKSFPPPPTLRTLGFALILLASITPALLLKTAAPSPNTSHPLGRLPWSEEEVSRQLAAGRTVFIDFTAAWCLTCQVNERITLSQPSVQAAIHDKNIAFLVADWTRRDPAITAALQKYGREGVPTYVLLRPNTPPQLLPELITPSLVLDALSR